MASKPEASGAGVAAALPTTSTLQLHPTRRCNLRCLHCYTSSGPDVSEAVPAELLVGAIRDAARLGYRAVAVSGGEPLLYKELPLLLDTARNGGMVATFTTNGMGLSPAVCARLKGHVDLVAVSVDGAPEAHDAIRGRSGAYTRMARGVGCLGSVGVPFAVLFTLTRNNLDDLPSVLEFALANGAALLQIHPLDGAGRALAEMAGQQPDAIQLAVASLMAASLAGEYGRLTVEVDAVTLDAVAANPGRFQGTGQIGSARLGEWVHPLIVTAGGEVLPIAYDFPVELGLGSLYGDRLSTLASRWYDRGGAERFASVCGDAFDDVIRAAQPITYWYEPFVAAVRTRINSVSSSGHAGC